MAPGKRQTNRIKQVHFVTSLYEDASHTFPNGKILSRPLTHEADLRKEVKKVMAVANGLAF